jgi:predicted ATPase
MFNFHVNNFRSFQNQNFNFSRINILIGENSGGKSSLLKLLLALKQTLESPVEVNLKLSGDYTDLGNYEEVVYYRNKNKKIKIGFGMGPKYFDFFFDFVQSFLKGQSKTKVSSIKKILSSFKDSKTEISFEFSSKLNDHSTIKTIIKNSMIGNLEILQKKGKYESNTLQLNCDIKFKLNKHNGIIENCNCLKDGFLTLVTPELLEKCNIQFKEESNLVFYSLAFLLVSQNYVREQIEKMRFVNPIGNSPKRFYFQEDKKASYKLIDIEKFINILSDKTLSEKQHQERIKLLNRTIKEFGIAEEVEIIKDSNLPVLALNVKTKDFWSNITDVGYGVSLQIPILFQALLSEHYTKKGQTLLIEQPEVHLHPQLQAKFIETLLSIGSKNTYFIETHSEHIIRKLQILIKNKTFNLKPGDVSIYYFKREPSEFSITEHTLQTDGKLNPSFPQGFYDTSYNLVKQLL